ncbi:MAG: hypothetical protein IPK26_04925 [Planctomycetes bacterium]|nr:hypothetical protein [Planctomycetota bacterium]
MQRCTPVLVPILLLLAACGSSTSSEGESPLEDLTSRLPSPSRLITGISALDEVVPSQAWSTLTDYFDVIDGIKDSWCHAKNSVDGGTIQVTSATISDEAVTDATYPCVSMTRQFTIAGSGGSCTAPTSTFTLRLDVVGISAANAVLTPPWQPTDRIPKAVIFGRFEDTDSTTITAANVAFVLIPGLPTAALSAADDFDHLPKPADNNLALLDDGAITAVFFPQNVAEGVGFGGLLSSQLPEVLTIVADLSSTTQRTLLGLFKWASPTDKPLVADLRIIEGATATGAVLLQRAATTEMFGPFFVDLGGADATSGFCLEGTAPVDLYEAWDGTREVTHTNGTQNAYTLPTGFLGWPGDSTTWTTALGQGRSTTFAALLDTLPAASTWFGSN